MNDDFWNNVFFAAEKLGVPLATQRVWKHRGRVPGVKIIPLYQVLKKHGKRIKLEQFM